MMTAARLTQPPTECTTVVPAKSMKPKAASQPDASPLSAPPQAQWPKTGYTSAAMMLAVMRNPEKRMRSATAPDMMMVAVPQNII